MADADEKNVRQNFWPKLQRNLARIPFADDVLAAWYCATDAKTPVKVKGTLFAALAYFILPFDVIPDFALGLGFTDDLAVLMTAMTLVRTHITAEHRTRAGETIANLKQQTFANQ
jgi:uncharacterized membrane protein YkvA (DUF1232 family)